MILSHSVGTTAVEIIPAITGRSKFSFVAIGNPGAKTAYIKMVPDTAALTISNGIPLPAGTSIVCNAEAQRDLFDRGAYAIAASGETTTVSVQAY